MHTLYIHIGTPKTGTSAFQNWMYTNEALLSSVGITYFNELIPEEQERTHWQIAYNLWQFSKKPETLAYINGLVEHIHNQPMSVGFLSAEALSFWIKRAEGFRNFIDKCRYKGITCHVVAVVRDPLEYMISAYGEDVTGGNCSLEIQDWLLGRQGIGHSKVINTIKKWEKVVPIEHIHWIRYESRRDFPKRILNYLLGNVFEKIPIESRVDPREVRKSMDGAQVEIFRRINHLILPNYHQHSPPPKSVEITQFIKTHLDDIQDDYAHNIGYTTDEETLELLDAVITNMSRQFSSLPFINGLEEGLTCSKEKIQAHVSNKLSYNPEYVSKITAQIEDTFLKRQSEWTSSRISGEPHIGAYHGFFEKIKSINMSLDKPKIVLILSMHRSGSSVIAQMMEAAGIFLGEQLLEGREDNPGGFWEHGPLVDLHTRMLRSCGGSWYLPGEIVNLDTLLGEFGEEARALVKKMDESGQTWAWKDPRMPLFLGFWREILEDRDLYFVVANRNPEAIIQSLIKRDGLPEDLAKALWVYHISMIIRYLPLARNTIWVEYEKLITQPNEVIWPLIHFLQGVVKIEDTNKVQRAMLDVIKPAWAHYVDSSMAVDRSTFHKVYNLLQLEDIVERQTALEALEVEANAIIKTFVNRGFSLDPETEKTRLYYKSDKEELVFSYFTTLQGLVEEIAIDFEQPIFMVDFKVVFNQAAIIEYYAILFYFKNEQIPVEIDLFSNAWESKDGILFFDSESSFLHFKLNSTEPIQIDRVQLKVHFIEKGQGAKQLLSDRLKAGFVAVHSSYHQLQESYHQLQESYHQLQESYHQQQAAYEDLHGSYRDLEAAHRHLQGGYQYLKDEYNSTVRMLLQIKRIVVRKAKRFLRRYFPNVPFLAEQSMAHYLPLTLQLKYWLERNLDVSRMYLYNSIGKLRIGKSALYRSFRAYPALQSDIRVLAFYLPQFHAIPENDAWWGEGFTEWTNVRPAVPHFKGHYQPRIPDGLGYYNLLDPTVQAQQVALAKNYGIGGFCFHFYWFNGVRLLEDPILNYLSNHELDLPFCLSWANENWSRRWDGKEQELLMTQEHSEADDIAFISYVSRYFKDSRYIRIDGKPLLLVYRPGILPNAAATMERWRTWCRTNGIGEVYLACSQSFDAVDPARYGMDAALEFPPNNMGPDTLKKQVSALGTHFEMTLYDWRSLWRRSWGRRHPGYKLFLGVTPSWDNTARRKEKGTAFLGSHPVLFQGWLMNVIRDTRRWFSNEAERLVFINAWNEWAEGAYLEPDTRYGYAYLEAVRRALTDTKKLRLGKIWPLRKYGFRKKTKNSVLNIPMLAQKKSDSGAFDRPKIILVVHDALLHGAQYNALEMVRTLTVDLKFEVAVVLLQAGPLADSFGELAQLYILSPDFSRSEFTTVSKKLALSGYKEAIINTSVSGWVIPYFDKQGITCISLVHEMPQIIHSYGLLSEVDAMVAYSKKVVFPQEVVYRGFEELRPLKDEQVVIRPQGLYKRNRWRYEVEKARQQLRTVHGLPDACKIVVSVGFADHRKGIDLFVEIARSMVPLNPSLAFIWIGSVHQELEYLREKVAADVQLSQRFIWAGHQNETGYYYAGADVYALTSREDPFPSVIMEAYDAGIPVVAFEGTGGAASLIAEKEIGIVVPAFDIDAFSAAIQSLVNTAGRAMELGKSGQLYVDKHLSFRKYMYQLTEELGLVLPKISVVMPNFNYARHIRERLDTIRNQRVPIYELIILDDASQDESKEAILDWMMETKMECRLDFASVNSGAVLAQWQKGVEMATGDYIWIAEADDLSNPDFLETVYAQMKKDPQVVLSYCESQQIDENGNLLDDSYHGYVKEVSDTRWKKDYIINGLVEIKEALAVLNTIPNVSGVLFRREALQAVLNERIEELRPLKRAFDYLLYVYLLEKGSIAYSRNAANKHRRHTQSVIAQSNNRGLYDEITTVQGIVAQHFDPTSDALEAAAIYRKKLEKQFGL